VAGGQVTGFPGAPVAALVSALVLLLPSAAAAHAGSGDLAGGFVAGFLHPLLGLDHLSAMVAVGIWGAQLGAPAIWMLPIAFPLVMTIGAAVGIAVPTVAGAEIGVAASAIVLGGAIAATWRPPLAVAAVAVGFFAMCHGYTHGTQLPASASALAFSIGFLVATGGLHGLGILLGGVLRWPWGNDVLRLGGALIATVGIWVLMPLVSP
jgi:urease accessory protein